MVCVRFAPSPTGYLHIGGVRTALFNFLYARNQQGKFLLRIEDTDRERSRPEFEEDILNSLRWLGLTWDGELMHQSGRLENYRAAARLLIEKDLAYEEKADGKTAVRFRMPKGTVKFHDLVRGEVQFDTGLFDDLVIIKSDGYPTYHLACVVDDHDTEISHVIRGEDHISNTPRQILLFEALGWKAPKYAHLPLIFGQDGTPLSKRHGTVSLRHYHEKGYLPDAVLNYLALLGWGSQDNQEFYRLPDLIKKFSIKRITKSNARFDAEKLDWLNAQHIKKMQPDEYVKQVAAFYPEEFKAWGAERWQKLVLLYQSRIQTLQDLKVQAAYCFENTIKYESPIRDDFFKDASLCGYLKAWAGSAETLSDFNKAESIEKITRDTAETLKIEAKSLIHPLRYALTGKTVSPGLFDLMSVLGKEKCLERVRKFIKQ